MNFPHAARLTRPRFVLLAVVLAVAGLLAATAQIASAAPNRSAAGPKPTIVLVHGAWADNSSWNAVAEQLQSLGYTVDAAPNPLRGVSYDSAYLSDFLSTISGPIVLVGHSYGGFVITNAATGNTQVKALVYDDAFIPAPGDTPLSLTAAKPGSCLAVDPSHGVELRALPGQPVRRRGSVRQAERVPRVLRQRPAGQRGSRARRRTAAAGRQHPVGVADHRARVADDPVLGRHRHRGPRHPARRAARHGSAGRGAHHQDRCPAPVHDQRPRRSDQGHPQRRPRDRLNHPGSCTAYPISNHQLVSLLKKCA